MLVQRSSPSNAAASLIFNPLGTDLQLLQIFFLMYKCSLNWLWQVQMTEPKGRFVELNLPVFFFSSDIETDSFFVATLSFPGFVFHFWKLDKWQQWQQQQQQCQEQQQQLNRITVPRIEAAATTVPKTVTTVTTVPRTEITRVLTWAARTIVPRATSTITTATTTKSSNNNDNFSSNKKTNDYLFF